MVQRLVYRSRHSYATKSNQHRIVKTPGGNLTYQTTKKRASGPKCPLTGNRILGIPHLTPAQFKRSRLSRNRRTVNRPYGGVLSGSAVRERIIRAFLVEEQKIIKQVLKLQKAKEKEHKKVLKLQKAKEKVAPESLNMSSDLRICASSAATGRFPVDILMEVLARLPVKTLMRSKCVSSVWNKLISSEVFVDFQFNVLSSRKERVYTDGYKLFQSNATTNAVQIKADLTTTLSEVHANMKFVSSVRGLMCYTTSDGEKIWVINFSNKQVLTLPQVEPKTEAFKARTRSSFNHIYFVYDSIEHEYKVMAILTALTDVRNETTTYLEEKKISETQVLVLGPGASWRKTKTLTSPPHPYRNGKHGIAINGVLYYEARSREEKCVLVGFNLSSETFRIYGVPEEAVHTMSKRWLSRDLRYREFGTLVNPYLQDIKIMNYHDQIALIRSFRSNKTVIIHLWVGEDVGDITWSHKEFRIPRAVIGARFKSKVIKIKPSFQKGEVALVISPKDKMNLKSRVFYDLDSESIPRTFQGVKVERKVKVRFTQEEVKAYDTWQPNVWEYVESVKMLCFESSEGQEES